MRRSVSEESSRGAGWRSILPKDERYVILLLALIRAGHVACPVSDRLPPKGVAQILGQAACQALISDNEELLHTVDENILRLRPKMVLKRKSSPTVHSQ